MDSILPFLIVCLMVMLAGFIDAIAGGGGLISLPAYMISGLPAHAAIATNKMSSVMGTLLATFKYARTGYIQWKLALSAVLFAVAGSTLGARLALRLPNRDLFIALLFIIPVAAFFVLCRRSFTPGKAYSFRKTACIAMAVSFLIGIYDGFSGPGTGTFLILLFTGAAHLPLTSANGLTKVINSTTNLAALTVFLLHGEVVLFLGITAGLFGMAGNYLGARYFTRGGAGKTRPIMLIVLVIFYGKVLYELFIR